MTPLSPARCPTRAGLFLCRKSNKGRQSIAGQTPAACSPVLVISFVQPDAHAPRPAAGGA